MGIMGCYFILKIETFAFPLLVISKDTMLAVGLPVNICNTSEFARLSSVSHDWTCISLLGNVEICILTSGRLCQVNKIGRN